jgi:hypothetical protein
LLASLYVLAGFSKAEKSVRTSLEGFLWDTQEGGEAFRTYVAETSLEKNTAESYGTAFYSYFS